jgi:hypothetical protein
VARYTVLRLLIFFGFVMLFWLIGLRDNPVLLLAASAIASAALSYVLLRGMRDEMTAKLVERHEARLAAKSQVTGDEADEDAEIAGEDDAAPSRSSATSSSAPDLDREVDGRADGHLESSEEQPRRDR